MDTRWTSTAHPSRELVPNGQDTGRPDTDPSKDRRTGRDNSETSVENVETAVGVVDEPVVGVTIGDAVSDALATISERPNHDPKSGRFLPGNTVAGKTLERSEAFWSAVKEAKHELVARLHADLAVSGDAAATLEGLTDAYAEIRLLRHAMFTRLVEMGGPITSKGRARRLFSSYLQTLDRERRLALDLGLERRSKSVDPVGAVARAVREANR